MCSTWMLKNKVHLHYSLLAEKEIQEWKNTQYSPMSEQKRWLSRKKIFPSPAGGLNYWLENKSIDLRRETHSTSDEEERSCVVHFSLPCVLDQHWGAIPEYTETPRTCKTQEIYAIKLRTRKKTPKLQGLFLSKMEISEHAHPCCWWSQKCPHKKNFQNECFQRILFSGGIKDHLFLIRFPVYRQESMV